MTHALDRRAFGALALLSTASMQAEAATPRDIMARAYTMKQKAIDAGDQAYGAVLAIDDRVIGESPSRVVTDRDPTAHAENSVLRDALRRGVDLSGATLYSTSIPCAMCQATAAKAGVRQMIYSDALIDAGAPRP